MNISIKSTISAFILGVLIVAFYASGFSCPREKGLPVPHAHACGGTYVQPLARKWGSGACRLSNYNRKALMEKMFPTTQD